MPTGHAKKPRDNTGMQKIKALEAKLEEQLQAAQSELRELQAGQRRIKDLIAYCQRHKISTVDLRRALHLMKDMPRAAQPAVSKNALKVGGKKLSPAQIKARKAAAGAQ